MGVKFEILLKIWWIWAKSFRFGEILLDLHKISMDLIILSHIIHSHSSKI